MSGRVVLLGYASGVGARDPGCGDGPVRLQASGLDEALRQRGIDAVWGELYFPEAEGGASVREVINRLNKRLSLRTAEIVSAGDCPLVLGGDHSSAVGTWRGTVSGLGEGKTLGLLWVDAHLDSHTPETTHSGMIHGMPLAVLLGRLGHGGPGQAVVQPEHVAVVGVRSYEPEEEALLQELGVRVYEMPEVEARGLDTVMREAHARVTQDTDGWGITVDVDSMDPTDAPGVGTPESGGLRAAELLQALREIRSASTPLALEIAEFNPHHDRDGITLRLVHELAAVLTCAETSAHATSPTARQGAPL